MKFEDVMHRIFVVGCVVSVCLLPVALTTLIYLAVTRPECL